MATTFVLHMPVLPIPKARARVTRRGFSYTPKRSKDAETELKGYMSREWKKEPLEGQISLQVTFGMYTSKANNKKIDRPHTARPDIDNLVKQVFDAGNGILWHDDSQIWVLTAKKVYAQEPFVEIVMDYVL